MDYATHVDNGGLTIGENQGSTSKYNVLGHSNSSAQLLIRGRILPRGVLSIASFEAKASWAALLGVRRLEPLVATRTAISCSLRWYANGPWTYEAIGELMARDHTTAMHHERAGETFLEYPYTAKARLFGRILRRLQNEIDWWGVV